MPPRRLRFIAALCTAALVISTSPLLAADPAPAPAATSTLSPAIQDALKDFSSEDFKTRSAASAKLQLALGKQLQALVNSDDPEVLSRLDAILHDNDGLTRWIIDTLKLPADQRKSQLEFGLKPEVLPSLALTFSSEPQKRADGIKALAKIDDPNATAILATSLDDPERRVYLAAMEAVWDKKPTDAIIESLWNRALLEKTPTAKNPPAPETNLKFRDQPLNDAIYIPGGNFTVLRQDADFALDVLINLKAPQVNKKIAAYLDEYDKTVNPADANPNPPAGAPQAGNLPGGGNILAAGRGPAGSLLFNPMADPIRNVFKLIEAYKPREDLPVLYKLATAEARSRNRSHNKDAWYWSNRTPPIAAIVIITGQKPEDYALRQANILGHDSWSFPSETDEFAAIKKLHDWYVANVDKNVPDITEEAPEKPLPPKNPATPKPANN